MAFPLQDIGPVDARRRDPDQHPARRRPRHRPPDRQQHLGTARRGAGSLDAALTLSANNNAALQAASKAVDALEAWAVRGEALAALVRDPERCAFYAVAIAEPVVWFSVPGCMVAKPRVCAEASPPVASSTRHAYALTR